MSRLEAPMWFWPGDSEKRHGDLWEPLDYDLEIGDRVRIPDAMLERVDAEEADIVRGKVGTVVWVDGECLVLSYEPLEYWHHYETITIRTMIELEKAP